MEEDSFGAEFLPQDLALLLEVHDHILLMPADPSRQHHQGHAHGFDLHHVYKAEICGRDRTRTELGTVAGGTVNFYLPPGDWVLIYTALRMSWCNENWNHSILICGGPSPSELVGEASRVAMRFWR